MNALVIQKNPADFVGAHIGHSEKNTKAVLASTVGKVLVIDEVGFCSTNKDCIPDLHIRSRKAYMLYSPTYSGKQNDPFKTSVIDTIVAEVQSTPGEDRCVLMLGYEDKMRDMFEVKLRPHHQ